MNRPCFAFALVVVVGCGGGPAPRPRTIASLPGRCVVAGEWTSGELLTPDGSFAYASVSQARARIDLGASPPSAHVDVDGFSLDGAIELTSTIRIVPPTALGENVLLPPGAGVSILAVQEDRAAIGLGRFSFDDSDQMTWATPPRAVVPCSSLGLGFAYRDEATERRERLALGLPLDPPTRFLAVGHALAIAALPGGPTQVTLTEREYATGLLVLEEQGGFTRIALQHWTGATLVGWVSSGELVAEEPAGEGGLVGGLLGAMGGSRTYQQCRADHALALSVRHMATTNDEGQSVLLSTPSAAVVVGTIAAGTPFVLIEARTNGTAQIEPDPESQIYAHGDVEWLVPSGTFACVERTYSPGAALSDVLE